MKLATYLSEGGPRIGAVVQGDTKLLDLHSAHEILTGRPSDHFSSMLALIEAGPAGLDAARTVVEKAPGRIELIALEAVTLMAPVPEPVQMRDGLCFEIHCVQAFKKAREVRAAQFDDPEAAMRDLEARGVLAVPKEFYDLPVYYKANRFSVAAPGQDIVWPSYSKVRDYELEYGVFIGKSGINIPRERALDHVFGYTIFNDLSARDAQVLEQSVGLGPAKGKDFKDGNPMGPWIVTADEIGDPYSLEMVVRVNGEERGRANSSSMYWRFEDLIARISMDEDLRAGEFIGSGTVGNGSGIESMRFLEHEDVVELEVEKIGVLRNRILVRQ